MLEIPFKPIFGNFILNSSLSKYIYFPVETFRPILNRGISSFVKEIRKQQSVRENENIPGTCYESGDFILFSKKPKKLLINIKKLPDGSKRFYLHRQSYKVVTELGLNVKNESVFLNVNSDLKCQFALEFSNEKIDKIVSACGGKFIGLRSSLFLLSKKDSTTASQGISLLSWRSKNVFCSNCGNLLENCGSSVSKVCKSELCINSKEGNRHHPPINPVGICLVSNESKSKVLLVRQPHHPPGMFTCIAGFIEIGETIEDNIKREVAEEVGLETVKVDYIASQHWAIPASRLMIGCHATVIDSDEKEEISIDSNELEDAGWFTPQQVKECMDRVKEISLKGKETSSLWEMKDGPAFHWVPPKGALAHTLIKWWLKTFHPEV